jgi:peptidoglycan/xylan/chitin deacetylase (PgdA/CDA1 family)
MKAILTYHSIDTSGSPISVSPDAFARHLEWLTGGAVLPLGLEDLLAHDVDGQDAVAITFDDAFLNTRRPILELLERRVPVTTFVVTDHVGGTNTWGGRAEPGIPTLPVLGWHDLAELLGAGASIGAHTRRHPRLSTLSDALIDDELGGARERLESELGVDARHFAYPYGDVTAAIATRASSIYRFGYTTDFRPLGSREAPMLLPRFDMYYFQAPGALDAWGQPAFHRRTRWIRARRTMRSLLSRSARPRN